MIYLLLYYIINLIYHVLLLLLFYSAAKTNLPTTAAVMHDTYIFPLAPRHTSRTSNDIFFTKMVAKYIFFKLRQPLYLFTAVEYKHVYRTIFALSSIIHTNNTHMVAHGGDTHLILECVSSDVDKQLLAGALPHVVCCVCRGDHHTHTHMRQRKPIGCVCLATK